MITGCIDSNKQEIINLYDSDLSLEQIAEKLSIGKTTLRNKINELGLTREPRIRRKNIAKEKIQFFEEQGLSYRAIAQKLNIHPSTLLRRRKRLGIYNPPREVIEQQAKATKARAENKKAGIKPEAKHKYNCLEIYLDEILELLYSGVSKTEVARRYNVSPQTVHNLLALYEIKIPVIKKLDGKENTIRRLFNKGLSVQEIANKFKCSAMTVMTKIAQKYNADLVNFECYNSDKEEFKNQNIDINKIKTKITNNPVFQGMGSSIWIG